MKRDRTLTHRTACRIVHSSPLGGFVVQFALVSLLVAGVAAAESAPVAQTYRASSHPMRYHLALPSGWAPGRSWPVVVVIPDAYREFADNVQTFAEARGARPFIIVAPEVLTCGGERTRTIDHYSYTSAEWDSLLHGDDYAFDDAGIGAVLADVHAKWGGETKAFLTGWEAGGHTVWAQAFRHPERWKAVAPVTPNYQRRGVTEATVSKAPERTKLPIRVFLCQRDSANVTKFAEPQTQLAAADARAHGFAPVTREVVPDVDHGPLPEAVLAWFASQIASSRTPR